MHTEILNFKEKDKLMKYIYRTYRQTKLQLQLMETYFNPYPQSENMLKETVTSYNDNYLHKKLDKQRNLELFIKMIDQVYEQISSESRFIIQKEYLEAKENNWWQDYYSKSTYYRLKHQALNEFFLYYDESLFVK